MTATTIERPRPMTRASRVTSPATTPVRPRRHDGRGTAPFARPSRAVAPPTVRAARSPGAQACALPMTTVGVHATWRLTDRGIAVVMVTGLMIVITALVVVGLTAVRVTGEHYQVQGQSLVR